MMHKLKKISVFLLTVSLSFTSGIYFEKLANSFYPHKNNTYEQGRILPDADKETTPAIGVEEVITADTKFVIVEYNLSTGEEIVSESVIPIKYIGLNRLRFIEEMENYEIAPALNDIKKGFRTLQVLSFSSGEVKIQKNYEKGADKVHYYIMVRDNKLVVYYEDMQTVFLTTEISLDSLPEDVKREVLQRKYFETEEEMYNFLESYSS